MLTLEYMLLQADGDKIYLLPAWPKTWNVSFKLRPRQDNRPVRVPWRQGCEARGDAARACHRRGGYECGWEDGPLNGLVRFREATATM